MALRIKKPTKARLLEEDEYYRDMGAAYDAKWKELCRRVATYKQINDAHPGVVQTVNDPFDDKDEFPGVYCEKMFDEEGVSWGLAHGYVMGGVVIPEWDIQCDWDKAIKENEHRRISSGRAAPRHWRDRSRCRITGHG